jgi:proline iminopeptidase
MPKSLIEMSSDIDPAFFSTRPKPFNYLPTMVSFAPGYHKVPVNGIELVYHVQGEGPLLFAQAPGWGIGMSSLWRNLAPLNKDFKLITVGTRGSGGSSRPDNPDDMGSMTMADDLETLRQYLGVDKIDLYGSSNGGSIALHYAAQYPGHIRNLILVGPQLIGTFASEESKEIIDKWADDPRYMAAIEAEKAADYSNFSDEYFSKLLTDTYPLYFYYPEKNVESALRNIDFPIASYATRYQKVADREVPKQIEILPKIKARTLIIVGRQDTRCPPVIAQTIHDGLEDSKLIIVEQCGHGIPADQPDILFDEIKSFLAVE